MGEGGPWEGKKSWVWGKGIRRGGEMRRRNGKSINLLGRHVTEFFTKSWLPMSGNV